MTKTEALLAGWVVLGVLVAVVAAMTRRGR
jgi:hypothetical protein